MGHDDLTALVRLDLENRHCNPHSLFYAAWNCFPLPLAADHECSQRVKVTMNELRTACPECETAMQPIKLIDATTSNLSGGVGHVELAYSAPDAKPSFFLGRIPMLGTVKGMICPECGRIVLYGEPHSS